MALDDLPAALISSGLKRRANAEIGMFARGHPYEDIVEVLEMMCEVDLRIATALRDRLSEVRGLPPDEIVAVLAQVVDDTFARFFD